MEPVEGKLDWQFAEHVSKVIQNSATALAVFIGGGWAFFRFARFRTLKPRLEFSFDWKLAGPVGILTLKLKNTGNTKITLRKGNRQQSVLKHALLTVKSTTDTLSFITERSDALEHSGGIFSAHRWVEPGETIDDVQVLFLNHPEALAVQFEALIFGPKKWTASAVAAFPLISEGTHSQSPLKGMLQFELVSEDEQEETTEKEELQELLGSRIADAKKMLSKMSSSRSDGYRKSDIEDIIQKGEQCLAEPWQHNDNPLTHEQRTRANELIETLDGYLGRPRKLSFFRRLLRTARKR